MRGFAALCAILLLNIVFGEMNPPANEGDVFLVGGKGRHEGNVLLYHNNQWGFVCDDYWGTRDATVVCRQLGYPGVVAYTSKSKFKQLRTNRRIWLDNVKCIGKEAKLTECRSAGWGRHNCISTEAAGVVCKRKATMLQIDRPKKVTRKILPKLDYEIALEGGRSLNEGFVSVKLNGKKGTICADNRWNLLAAYVVCKQLGLGFGELVNKDAFFGGSNLPKLIGGIECKGNEAHLSECTYESTGESLIECAKKNVAGIVCNKKLPDLVPDVRLLQSSAYVQDRPLFYLQCAMEENCVSSSAYDIVRTIIDWHVERRRLLRFSSSILNNGTADFRPIIPKLSWEWHSCHLHYHSMDIFAHYDLIDNMGVRQAEGHKASFCLEDSVCKDGVKKNYACIDLGDQGISVGCSDDYLHDIDCQWIDITDLRPGKYIFRVVINPEYKIAELDYNNNGVICDAYYTGYHMDIRNCRHGR